MKSTSKIIVFLSGWIFLRRNTSHLIMGNMTQCVFQKGKFKRKYLWITGAHSWSLNMAPSSQQLRVSELHWAQFHPWDMGTSTATPEPHGWDFTASEGIQHCYYWKSRATNYSAFLDFFISSIFKAFCLDFSNFWNVFHDMPGDVVSHSRKTETLYCRSAVIIPESSIYFRLT